MKPIKFVILAICAIFSMVMSIELYRSYSSSFNEFDFIMFEEIQADSSLPARLQRIDSLFGENDLDYFLVNTVGTHGHLQNEIYCSSTSVRQELEKNGHREGLFKSLFSGDVTVTYKGEILNFCNAPQMNDRVKIYLLHPIEDYSLLSNREYIEANLVTVSHTPVSYLLIRIIWIVFVLMLLILSLVDSALSKKEILITALNGYRRSDILTKRLGIEILGLLLSAGIPMLCLHRYILPILQIWEIPIIFAIGILADLAITVLATLTVDVRRTLSNAGSTAKIVVGCHILRIAITIMVIMVSAVAVNVFMNYRNCLSEKSFVRKFDGYDMIFINAENFSEEEIDELGSRCVAIRLSHSIPDSNGTAHDVYYLNRSALAFLGDKCRIDADSVNDTTVFAPAYMQEEIAVEFAEDSDPISLYDESCTVKHLIYGSSGDDIVSLNEYLNIIYSNDPILVVFEEDLPFHDPNLLQIIPSDVPISHGLQDRYEIYPSFLVSIEETRIKFFMWLIIVVSLLLLQVALQVVLLNIEHSANSMELCIKKVTGTPFLDRYRTMTLLQILSNVAGIILILMAETGLSKPVIILSGLINLLFILTLEITLASLWERENVPKTLKGGSL